MTGWLNENGWWSDPYDNPARDARIAILDQLAEEVREHSRKPEPEPQSDYDWWNGL